MHPVENPFWKKPFETERRDVEALVRTAMYEVVASVVVANLAKRRSMDEEADTRIPTVVVG